VPGGPALLTAAAAAVGEVVVLGEGDGATPIAALLATDGPAPEPAVDPDTAVALLPTPAAPPGCPGGSC
jgi:hypothetical protein